MLEYINDLSREDTYIIRSGEQLTFDEEETYITDALKKMHEKRMLKVCAFMGDELVGLADLKKGSFRSKHVGEIAISVKNGYRDLGIGTE